MAHGVTLTLRGIKGATKDRLPGMLRYVRTEDGREIKQPIFRIPPGNPRPSYSYRGERRNQAWLDKRPIRLDVIHLPQRRSIYDVDTVPW